MKKVLNKILAVFLLILALPFTISILFSEVSIFHSIIELIGCFKNDGGTYEYTKAITQIVLNLVFIYILVFMYRFSIKTLFKKKKVESESLDSDLIDDLEE